MGYLFPGLPDEIGLECLLRLELKSFHNVRPVCKRWNGILENPKFYQERKRLKISEQRICMLQKVDGICDRVAVYDLNKNSCKSLPLIPTQSLNVGMGGSVCHFHFVKQNLVLIKDVFCDSTRSCVWLYDFRNGGSKWRQGAKMPMDLQNGFASAADEHGGLIYVAGGFGDDTLNSPVRSAFVYNVEEDKWDVLPDMNTYLDFFLGAFVDGKFYVMGNPSGPSFEIFDSYTRSWKTMENRFNNRRCFVTAFGRLHCLSVRGLIEYDYSQDNVNIVGTFPTEDWGLSIKFAGVVSNKIIVGKKNPIEGQDFYMLAPPSETGGTLKLIGFERPSGLEGSTICAATLDL